MNDSSLVNVLKSKTNLDEPIENLSLREVLSLIHLPFNVITKVSYFAVLHYDYNKVESEVALFIGNNMRMV
jgi:hypothetical protein